MRFEGLRSPMPNNKNIYITLHLCKHDLRNEIQQHFLQIE